MINRLESRLLTIKERNEKALIPYIMAGDPDLDTSVKLALALADSGADALELGIPFSDPVADGPAIQKAASRALTARTTVACIFKAAAAIRGESDIPLVLMTYYNPVLQYGLKEFAASAYSSGVDGLIIPDLPLEESKPLQRVLKETGIALVPLIAPNSGQERIAAICEAASGFIYCVSVTGITGVRNSIETDLDLFTSSVKRHTNLPVAIGFGISGPESAARVAEHCDAVVVGSHLVNLIEKYAGTPGLYKVVSRQVAEIKNALKPGGEISAAL